MKKEIFFYILFLVTFTTSAQDYDVYYLYFVRAWSNGYDSSNGGRPLGDLKYVISEIGPKRFSFFPNGDGMIDEKGVVAYKSEIREVSTSAYMRGEAYLTDNMTSVYYSNSLNGTLNNSNNYESSLDISISQTKWYTSGVIRSIPKITLTRTLTGYCFDTRGKIFSIPEGHPDDAIIWSYSKDGVNWKILTSELDIDNISLVDLFPEENEYLELVGQNIFFKAHNKYNDYNVFETYSWFGCSIELGDNNPIQITNATCYSGNNGSVTLNFKGDVEPGYEMRYFIFQGEPSEFPSGQEKNPSPTNPNIFPQAFDNVRFSTGSSPNQVGPMKKNPDDSYFGQSKENLAEGAYYVLYQEVKYNGLDVAVKSGEITPKFTISQPSEIKISIPPQNISQPNCFGEGGSVTIDSEGGGFPPNPNAVLEYGIQGDDNSWQTSATFSDLPADNYVFVARSSKSCVSKLTQSITIIVPDALSFTNPSPGTTSSSISTDGVISIEYAGGTPDYTFQLAKENMNTSVFEIVSNPNIDDNTFTKSVEFRNLGVGTYRITITDQNGCFLTTESIGDISVSSTPLPVLGLEEIAQITCPGAPDGTITVTVSGGITPYNYQWTINGVISSIQNNGNQVISLNNISEPGEYILKVASRGFTDFTNPSGYATSTINLIAPDEVIIQNASVNNITCNGAQDGSITILPSGGTSYQFKLDFYDPWTDLNANTIPISSGGYYDIYLRNEYGCEAIPLLDLLVEEPEELLITGILPTNLSTADSNDGAIDITMTGGTLPYSYQWTGPNGLIFNTEDLSGLVPGDYKVTITDANGCKVTSTTITIIDPATLLVTLNQTVFLECYGDDFAELTANVNGGLPPYTYEWFRTENGNNTQLVEVSALCGNLATGTYFVRVSDVNEISVNSSPITIIQPDLLSIVVDHLTNVACNGYATGAIDISVTGGTAPYDYLWSNGAISEDLPNVSSGTYSLQVLDDNGCRTEIEITIESPDDAIKITNESIKNVSEYQGNDGSITLALSGGAAPYTITWTKTEDGQVVGNERSISNLSVGNYEMSITDGNGCSLSKSYVIEQPDIVAETIVPISCAGQNDGSIAIVVNQGDGIFGYAWNTGATTNSISNLQAGSYTVTITGLGDAPITRSYIIDEPMPLSVDLGRDKTLCAGQVLELDASVEDASAIYSWTSDTGFTSSKALINVTATGSYSVMVSNPNGCSASGSVFVDISEEEISAEFAVSSQIFAGESLVAVDISYPLPEMIEWIVPEGAVLQSENQDELELLFEEPGEYEIGILTKRGLCEATQIKKVMVLEKDPNIVGKNNGHSQKKVDNFIIYPNPTNGKFSADISMNEVGEISLKIFSFANNTMMDHKKGKGQKLYSIPFDLAGTPSGVYAVLLETPYGNALRKVVIK